MPLSGVVIKCRPELTEGLATTLAKQETVEIHGAMPDGRLVAVIESDSLEGELEIMTNMLATDGIIDVQLVYHSFEAVNRNQ
jgi:nitrate reductase NapD